MNQPHRCRIVLPNLLYDHINIKIEDNDDPEERLYLEVK